MFILWTGRRKAKYKTLEEATKAANEIARKTGIILTITEEKNRSRGR